MRVRTDLSRLTASKVLGAVCESDKSIKPLNKAMHENICLMRGQIGYFDETIARFIVIHYN